MNGSLPPKSVIGIVGGVGAGKSTAAGLFAELGCTLVDADAIGHALLAERDVKEQLRKRWGGSIFAPDGSVDRKALGAIVFDDSDELAALNRIMHPRIRARMTEQIAAAANEPAAKAVVVDAAVLLEAGWDDLCTHLVFVGAPDEVRSRRALQKTGWNRRDWIKRENSQIPVDTKARRCYYTLDNSSSTSHLQGQIRRLLGRILHAADQ